MNIKDGSAGKQSSGWERSHVVIGGSVKATAAAEYDNNDGGILTVGFTNATRESGASLSESPSDAPSPTCARAAASVRLTALRSILAPQQGHHWITPRLV